MLHYRILRDNWAASLSLGNTFFKDRDTFWGQRERKEKQVKVRSEVKCEVMFLIFIQCFLYVSNTHHIVRMIILVILSHFLANKSN